MVPFPWLPPPAQAGLWYGIIETRPDVRLRGPAIRDARGCQPLTALRHSLLVNGTRQERPHVRPMTQPPSWPRRVTSGHSACSAEYQRASWLEHRCRTTRHPGYQISQVIRKRIEEASGWIKTVAGMAQTKFRGLARVGWMFQFNAAAYNLIRLPGLLTTG